MLRVLIDASALPEDRGGVGRYVDEIVSRLPDLGVDAHVAAQPRDLARYAGPLGSDHVHTAPGWAASAGPRLLWEQVGLPRLVSAVRPHVLHSPHYTLPVVRTGARPGARRVVTLHDATFFSDPDLHSPVKARFFAAWTRLSCRLADALVVPSRATRDEVVRYTGVDPARLTVIHHGVDHDRFRRPTESERRSVREWLGLGDSPYVAFLGTLEPRKNVPALVDAFVATCQDREDPPVLVLAGGRGWDEQIDPAVARVPGRLRVLRPGFVPDGLVPALLGDAELVAYPAFGEGFGLPVLEAMACGAAVLTTRRLSLPEVGGDAVAYAETPDAADVAVALARLLDHPAERTRLGESGILRAATFTWDAAAAAHVRVFEQVSGVPSQGGVPG